MVSTRSMTRRARIQPRRGLYTRIGRMTRAYRQNLFTMNRRKKSHGGYGVTVQHDSRRIYRRKRMPAKRRRRWKSFVKKVNYVNEKDMGTRTVIFSTLTDITDQTPGYQSVICFSLYGQKSSLGLHNDLQKISTLENTGNPTAAAGATVSKQSHIYFQSGVLDLTLRNTSYKYDGLQNVSAPEAQLEVDVYEMYCRQDFSTSGADYTSLGPGIQNEQNQELAIGGIGSPVNIYGRGVTPFDCPTALSRLGIKILKKTKYFIPNQNTITYQIRDPSRKTCLIREIGDEDGANKPKWTKWIMVIAKLVPELVKGTNPNTYTEQLQCGVTRKYMYKVEGQPENRSFYSTQQYSNSNPA